MISGEAGCHTISAKRMDGLGLVPLADLPIDPAGLELAALRPKSHGGSCTLHNYKRPGAIIAAR